MFKHAVLKSLFWVVALAACKQPKDLSRDYRSKPGNYPAESDGTKTPGSSETANESPVASPTASEVPAIPLSDADMMAFLSKNCSSCHEAVSGSMRGSWALPTQLNKDTIAKDSKVSEIYFTLLFKSRGITGGQPQAMPPRQLNDEEVKVIKQAVAWFENTLPTQVNIAKAKYDKSSTDETGVKIVINYQCDAPITLRQYAHKITTELFERGATSSELVALSGDSPQLLDQPVTSDMRRSAGEKLADEKSWKNDFENLTLKKFATRLANANAVRESTNISHAQANDLKTEVFELLRREYASKSWKDILLTDHVYVTSRTASLYEGCNAPSGDGVWSSCTLTKPRGSLFTTIGFLTAAPSSFLLANNNYGRVKVLHYVVSGDTFKPGFADEGGSTTNIPPLPSCLRTGDFRGTKTGDQKQIAPYGTAAVPLSAVTCQSCHIARLMAAGSILFRPFSTAGLIYTKQLPLDLDLGFNEATGPQHVNDFPDQDPVRVDINLLKKLAEGNGEQACAPAQEGGGQEKLFHSVSDMAAHLIGDGTSLSTGLARHFMAIFANRSATTDELVIKIKNALAGSGGKLLPAFQAYITSETFACEGR